MIDVFPDPKGSHIETETYVSQVVTIGEILVEIMAEERGTGFRERVHLVGPFPSGAPAIFIDQVAKLGQACRIISCVGDDDFGWMNLERLQADGVDVGGVARLSDQVTGSAFVRYRDNGDRDFVFNIKNSACGQLRWTDETPELLSECSHLHISGASLFSPQIVEMVMKAAQTVKGNGGTISFDPNIRKEVTRDQQMRAALAVVLASCDVFLPSGEELTLLTEAKTPQGAVAEILGLGVTAIVVKNGANGSTYYDAGREPASTRIRRRGTRPDRCRGLLQRYLRDLPSSGSQSGGVPRLRQRRGGARGHHQGTDGRARQPLPSLTPCDHRTLHRRRIRVDKAPMPTGRPR